MDSCIHTSTQALYLDTDIYRHMNIDIDMIILMTSMTVTIMIVYC